MNIERRIRNLERIVVGIGAIAGPSLNKEANEALDRAVEAFFYSISDKGIEVRNMGFEPPEHDEVE